MFVRGLKSSIIALESNLKNRTLFFLLNFVLLVTVFIEILTYKHSIALELHRYQNFTDDILIVQMHYDSETPYTFSSIFDRKLASIENVLYTQYAINQYIYNKETYQLSVKIKGTSGNFIENYDIVDFYYKTNGLPNVKKNELIYGRVCTNEEYQKGESVGLIYEATAKTIFGKSDATGERLNFGSHSIKIIGILKNTDDIKNYYRTFNNYNLEFVVYTPITYLKSDSLIDYSIMRSYNNDILKEIITNNISEKMYFYEREDVISKTLDIKKEQLSNFYYVIVVTLIICVVGLFQLIKNFINQMTFECSIRRTFGATKFEIFSMLVFQNSFVFLLALMLAIVVSIMIIYAYFYFSYRYVYPYLSYIDINIILIIGIAQLILTIAFTTLLSQKIINTNIIDGVKGNS